MIKSFFSFIRLILLQKYLIGVMAKRELETQYVGSLLGFIWTFIQPIVMISVFWFVFSVGFRVQPTNNVPFVVWLAAGMASWLVFADIINGSAGVVVSHAHFIKKTLFPAEILPIIKLASCLITHFVFIIILLILIVFHDLPITLSFLQFLYYLFCMSVLALGLGFAVSAFNVFIRDISQMVVIALQLGFWTTPIFWDIHIMPPKVQTILKLNPMFYIVQGYRDSFIYSSPFWEHPYQTLYFWVVTLTIFSIGALIFRKLKPQFADVL